MPLRTMNENQPEQTPWRDEQRLGGPYIERELSQREIAEELGCSRKTVANRVARFGIERDRPWRDAGRSLELGDERVSMQEIGDRPGTCRTDISRWMDDLITPCHARHVSTEAGTEEVGR